MQKYLIVTDSTSAITPERAEAENIKLVPLSVILEGKEYKDFLEMSKDTLYQHLRDGKVPSTSQPSVGYVESLLEEWKEENYDAIIVICVSSGLSGTCHSFMSAKEHLEMDNVHVVDSRSVGAPILDMALEAKALADEGKDVETIMATLQKKIDNSFSFLYPATLTQLKKGGRISPVAANMASLLKIKPLLYLADNGNVVDKFSMARTEAKIFDMMIEQFKKEHVGGLTHKIYIDHADNLPLAKKAETIMKEQFDNIECEFVDLPAVLTCHGGLGCIALQTTLKTR